MSVYRTASVPTHARRQRRGAWLLVAGAALIALPLLLVVGAYLVFRVSDTISPGVSVGGVPVGGLSLDQAIVQLDRAWNQELQITAVDTADAGRIWLVNPSEFGLRVDAASSARQAYAHGRANGLGGIPDLLRTFSAGFQLTPVVHFDEAAARAGLQRWSASVSFSPQDAQLGLASGRVNAVPSQWGRRLDVDTSLALLEADPQAVLLNYGFIALVTEPVAPRISEVATAANDAERLLAAPVSIRAYDPVDDEWSEWSPTLEERSDWISIQTHGGTFQVEPDRAQIEAYVAKLQSQLGEQRQIDAERAIDAVLAGLRGENPEPLIVKYAPRYYTVLSSDTLISISFKVGIPYWKWLDDNPQVSARGLLVGESLTIPPRDAMLELPVVTEKRIVVSLGEQRMRIYQDGEMLAEHIVSTGIPNSPTMPGIFQVKSHHQNAYASNWDLYMPNFLGIYLATPNLLNGIHGLPLLSNGVRLWANVLGSPASYGCIILDLEAAEQLYSWAEDGVVVEITS